MTPHERAKAASVMVHYAIVDGDRLVEESGTGKLAIYYAYDDAASAFPGVKRGADKSMQAGLRIIKVEISKAQEPADALRPGCSVAGGVGKLKL